MEYGEAIDSDTAGRAFSAAVKLWEERHEDPHQIAIRAVASAYCACVTDGLDAVERRPSSIQANLIEEVERRLTKLAMRKEKS
jgi:hypothetical protein